MFNPKLKDFLNENENQTMLDFAWSCYWRLLVVIMGISLAMGVMSELLSWQSASELKVAIKNQINKMFKTLSTKLKDILFGDIDVIEGGKTLRKDLSYPKLDGSKEYIYWEGNLGLIITMWQKIEKLEKRVAELECSKSKVA